MEYILIVILSVVVFGLRSTVMGLYDRVIRRRRMIGEYTDAGGMDKVIEGLVAESLNRKEDKYKSEDKVVLHKIDDEILLEEGYKVGDSVTLTHQDPYGEWHGTFPDGEEWSLVDCSFHRQVAISDNVNSPSHYNHSGIECIDALAASLGGDGFKSYCRGNVIKYLWRLEHKGKSIEDAKKARWYLNKLIERMEENG